MASRSALLAAILLLAIPGVPVAEAGSFAPQIDLGDYEGWYVPAGITTGITMQELGDRLGFIGVEVSAVYCDIGANLLEMRWLGLYADAYWVGKLDQIRFTVGPELGWMVVGLDVGYVGVATFDGGYTHGMAARIVLTASILAAYFRWDWLAHARDYGELGILVKFPFRIR
jgi:hypothetical protein